MILMVTPTLVSRLEKKVEVTKECQFDEAAEAGGLVVAIKSTPFLRLLASSHLLDAWVARHRTIGSRSVDGRM